jgi:hypothetical protein
MQKIMNVFQMKRRSQTDSHADERYDEGHDGTNMMSQGEGSNPSMHKGGGGDKNPGRNGGNGASPPPSPPPSSSHLLLLLLPVRRIFPILQRGMVKLLRKFLL